MKRTFFQQDTVAVARELLGSLLVYRTPEGTAGGMIVETEAYVGAIDKACHAYKGRSSRTEIMFHEGGLAYVYLIYGMYYCFNIVTGPAGEGNAVLIRALEPVVGLDLMGRRRKTQMLRNLCSGPGKVCRALAIGKKEYGMDLCASDCPLQVLPYRKYGERQIIASPRINVDYAGEAASWPWRFSIADNPFVSR